MRFALGDGKRQEAQPGLSGECCGCGAPTVAKCGETRVWHWAHKRRHHCDPWWENETEWHRAWKNQFPPEWQEFIHTASDGERHIADVKTAQGWVIEFQHSFLSPEERRSREAFYRKLIWVVDGEGVTLRGHLASAWGVGAPVANSAVRKVFAEGYGSLRKWMGPVHVFFDLGEEEVLHWFFESPTRSTYLAQFRRARFIECHRSTRAEFDECVRETINAQLRKVTKKRGAFPTADSVRKVLYLAIMKASERWSRPIKDWHSALYHLSIVFPGRVPL